MHQRPNSVPSDVFWAPSGSHLRHERPTALNPSKCTSRPSRGLPWQWFNAALSITPSFCCPRQVSPVIERLTKQTRLWSEHSSGVCFKVWCVQAGLYCVDRLKRLMVSSLGSWLELNGGRPLKLYSSRVLELVMILSFTMRNHKASWFVSGKYVTPNLLVAACNSSCPPRSARASCRAFPPFRSPGSSCLMFSVGLVLMATPLEGDTKAFCTLSGWECFDHSPQAAPALPRFAKNTPT